jgi:hypothetical protein
VPAGLVWEALAAALLALAALVLVFQPLVAPGKRARRPAPAIPAGDDDADHEETPSGTALAALKEIEFDRETGKLSDDDYAFLKAKYTRAALAALRADELAKADDLEAMIAARARVLRQSSGAATGAGAAADAGAVGVVGTSAGGFGESRSEAGGILSSGGAPLSGPACAACGPRPEPDARFCSTCGGALAAACCAGCGAALPPDSRFCERCGSRVAA